jgi:hypothetical protein
MFNTYVGSGAVYQVESLPDGSMGGLSIAVDPDAHYRRIVIDDGLIVRDPFAPMDAAEYMGFLCKGFDDIKFAIVCASKGEFFAATVARRSPIVKALTDAGWVLHSVHHIQGGCEF